MSKGIKPTQEQLKNWLSRGLLKPEDLSSTRTGSSLSEQPSPKESKSSPPNSELPKIKDTLNKTEREWWQMMLDSGQWEEIEPLSMKLRLGPLGETCNYTPDFTAVTKAGKQFCLIEVKGPFEYEDARVKRMAAARLCARYGWGFVFAKKKKGGEWQVERLA